MSDRVRIGVVGTGSLGFHHARILRDVEDVAMAGIFESRGERADEVSRELGVPAHPHLDGLLEQADAVVVAVPTVYHEEVAVRALEAGVHVLIEKPMAPDLASADRILRAASASGCMVQIGHVERFNPAVRAAEPWLDGPLFIESHRMAPFTARSTDVAVVLDLMIHDVDLVGSLVGAPVIDIAASGAAVLTSTIDIASARLTFASGAVANLTASRVSLERTRKIRFFQPSGYLSLNLAEGTGEFLRLKRELPNLSGGAAPLSELPAEGLAGMVERIVLEGDGAEPLRKELENFRDAVRGISKPAVSGEEGREALAVTLAIEERIRAHVADQRTT